MSFGLHHMARYSFPFRFLGLGMLQVKHVLGLFIYNTCEVRIGVYTMAVREISTKTFNTSIYSGGKGSAPFTDLDEAEIQAIEACLDMGIEHFEMTSPKLARIIAAQREDFITWGGFAKAAMDDKVIGFPSKPGGIGVCWINPQSRQFSSSDTYTQYNGWTINSNELAEITAGEKDYFFGDGTNWYKSYPTTPKRSMSIIAKDGLVEIGTTPSFQVHQIKTENDTQYGIIAEPPTYMLPIDDNLGVYVHKTLGQIPLWYDLGVEWSFLPLRTCTPVVMLAGVTFYEHEFLPNPVVRT